MTYTVAMALALLSRYKGVLEPNLWSFLMIFTQMQLVEYFLWSNLTNPAANAFWSAVGLALILLQPTATLNMLKDKRFLLAYILGAGVYLLTTNIDLRTTVGRNGHLKWNWNIPFGSIYALLWLMALFIPLYVKKAYYGVVFGIITLLTSMYFNTKYGTVGSYWCWLVVGTWILSFFTAKM